MENNLSHANALELSQGQKVRIGQLQARCGKNTLIKIEHARKRKVFSGAIEDTDNLSSIFSNKSYIQVQLEIWDELESRGSRLGASLRKDTHPS